MFKKIKNIALSLTIMLGLAAPFALPAVALAQVDIRSNLCTGAGLDITATDTNCAQASAEGTDKANSLIKDIINIFSLIVGIISVIMIIFGGLRYITSGGDSTKVGGAKNTILYAIIGLVIVALAQVIVRFVLSKATQ